MERGLIALIPERMTVTAYEKLYESVNAGRLIAFVGSGASRIYGYPNWREFVDAVLDRLKHDLRSLGEPHGVAVKRIEAEIPAIISRQEEPVIVLEFVRQAYEALGEASGDKDKYDFGHVLQRIFGEVQSVANVTAPRLKHAGLKVGIKDDEGNFAQSELTDALDTLVSEKDNVAGMPWKSGKKSVTVAQALYDAASDLYDTRTLVGLAEGSTRGLDKVAEKIRRDSKAHKRKTRLAVDRRSLLSVFLAGAVMVQGNVTLPTISHDERIDDDDGSVDDEYVAKDENGGPPPRPHLDPIRGLYENLSIRRYFTTNYDFEIENYFMFDDIRETDRTPITDDVRKGLYQRPDFHTSLDGSSITRHRPDGLRVRSDVNDGKNTAPLEEFGFGSSDGSIHIFHHHGRIDLPKSLVAADGEYNRMYRSEGRRRISLERAYDAMIDGNPILFVGSGLTEMELTRTLRHRVSNRPGPNDTPIFVLREAKDPPEQLMNEQLTLATKLDVHVIHYGHPRRGRGFSLREHLLLIDELAERFLPRKGFEPLGRRRLEAGSPLTWKRNITDCTLEEAGLLNERVFDIAKKAGWEARCQAMIHEDYRLIADLDYDVDIVLWLLGQEGKAFTDQVKRGIGKPGKPDSAKFKGDDGRSLQAGFLMFDYLKTLTDRLKTAALRHELRQIGREAGVFFSRKAQRPLHRVCGAFNDDGKAASVPTPWSRHLFVDRKAPEKNDSKSPRVRFDAPDWYWSVLRPEGQPHPGRGGFDALMKDISKRGSAWARTVVIGDRGTAKGRFLKCFRRNMLEHDPNGRWLILNCAYGLEADSMVSIIEQFLRGQSGAASGKPFESRRERLLRYRTECQAEGTTEGARPLLVLGAIDRLFGISSRPLGAEFEWLLEYLTHPNTPVDLVITASRRCLPYFVELAGTLQASEAAPASGANRRKPLKAGQERGPSPNHKLTIYRVEAAGPHGVVEQGTDRAEGGGPVAGNGEAPGWLGIGLLRRLSGLTDEDDRKYVGQDVSGIHLRMRNDQRRNERVIGRVIDTIFERQDGAPEPNGQLAKEMLKTLAFVGLPIEGETLFSAPGVRRELQRILWKNHPTGDLIQSGAALLEGENPPARKHFLAALQLLMDKYLVDLVDPHGSRDRYREAVGEAEKAISGRYRFTLHRLVSLVLRGRFGLPVAETVLSDSYDLSLYAAQPDDAPIFSPEIINDLEQLVDHLLHAWRDVTLAPALKGKIDTLRNQLLHPDLYASHALAPDLLTRLGRYERAVKMLDPLVPGALRAAGGLIRGFFSSVNLLGLDMKDPLSRNDMQSVLTVHKQRIRLLLDEALQAEAIRRDLTRGQRAVSPPGTPYEPLDKIFQVRVQVAKSGPRETPKREMETVCLTPDREDDWRGKLAEDALKTWQDLRVSVQCVSDPQRGPALQVDGQPVIRRLDTILGEPAHSGAASRGFPHAVMFQTFALHEEEMIWLLNERAMLSLAQGDLYGANTTFQLASAAVERVEGTRYQPMRCRLTVNRALLRIERGQIAEARRLLEEMQAGIGSAPDTLTRESREGRLILALAKGYLGLCDQLNGLFSRAELSYRQALRELSKLRELRAVAIFEFHLGSLLQTDSGRRDEASACYHRAVSAAEGGRHTDILYRIRVAQAHNDRIRDEIDSHEALQILGRAVEYGEQLDIHRVRVEALSARAYLRLVLGDVDAASGDCQRAIALASQYGMTLRRIWLRATSGKIFAHRGDQQNASYMFERAIEAAERCGYHRAVEDASQQLMQISVR